LLILQELETILRVGNYYSKLDLGNFTFVLSDLLMVFLGFELDPMRGMFLFYYRVLYSES
jgi:hypothetical protein